MNFFIKMICIVCFSLAPLSVEAASTKKAFVQHQDWVKFISKDHRFSIDFPLSPEHNGGSIEVPDTAFSIHYDTYISAYSDQIIFVVSVWEYPPVIDLSQPEINLNEGLQGMLQALPGATIEKKEMTKTQGYQTLDFLVKGQEVFFRGKLILVDNVLYQVFSIAKGRESLAKDFDYFANSFLLLKEGKLLQHKGKKSKI